MGTLEGVSQPLGFAGFLRNSWGPLSFALAEIKAGVAVTSADQRFDTLLDVLSVDVPAFSFDTAVRLARVNDDLQKRREPFDRTKLSMDAARHAHLAISGPDKGRMLAAVVRFMRASYAIEIGTAYGLSALYLAEELGAGGVIATVEGSEPQATIARSVLGSVPSVSPLKGWSHEVVASVESLVGSHAQVMFHDGGHSHDSYVSDFTSYSPLLAPGAVVIFDDIRWEDPAFSAGPARTYEGWLAVVANVRVRRAVELNNALGLLQLR